MSNDKALLKAMHDLFLSIENIAEKEDKITFLLKHKNIPTVMKMVLLKKIREGVI